ncbi:MAG TPA: hypothetical protein ENH10_01290 [Bacteroidetes bacterium]|nr:hypothetical protein [Bacteroidota bacterium]HEX03779.1 hypothetical protein [Bacteroidota bacterium]
MLAKCRKGARKRRIPFFLPSDDDHQRFGSLVPKRLYGNAIGRNYARRRLREYFRRNKSAFPVRCQMIVRLYSAPADWEKFLIELERCLVIASKKASQLWADSE